MPRLSESPEFGLFLAVSPIFVRSLPLSPSKLSHTSKADRKSLALNNAITLLRVEIQQMEAVFPISYAEHELPEDIFNTAKNALEDILEFLETLLLDHVLSSHSQDAVGVTSIFF